MAKTSDSHPLRIDVLRLQRCTGEIGLTFCPGKKQRDALSGHWDRDLALDLVAILQWSPAAVVKLVEPHEFEDLGVPMLPERMREQAFDWYHLPIVDTSVPAAEFERAWHYAGTRLRSILREGRKVLVHCKGSIGRAGVVAARLLVEMSEAPASAMARVREARPGAIENTAQEAYVRSLVNVPLGIDVRRERALGCLLGGAVGDAFGYEVEFKDVREIEHRFGPGGLREPLFRDGKIICSDDTQMTIFTLDALSRSTDALRVQDLNTATANLRQAYLDWLSTQDRSRKPSISSNPLLPFPELHVGRAPGNTCMDALRAGGGGTVDQPINDSKGCGTVMRTAPCGLFGEWLDDQQVFDLAARASAITHGHSDGIAAGAAMAVMIAACLRGEGIRDAAVHAMTMAAQWRAGLATVEKIRAALEHAAAPATHPLNDVMALGKGWVAEEALAVGLYSASVGSDFAHALQVATHHDGDSDSTASIAGQLWGASHGLNAIPHRWATAIDLWRPMMHTVDAMPAFGGCGRRSIHPQVHGGLANDGTDQ